MKRTINLIEQALYILLISVLTGSSSVAQKQATNSKQTHENITAGRPRVIVSSDIGGTDADDFQSMIHYLMYADKFETEGLISSPYGAGRKEHIFKMLELYEKDYPKLKQYSKLFPTPDELL